MTPETKTTDEFAIDVTEMAQAGLHLGHRLSRIHPKMKPFVYGMKNGMHIIDLEKAAVKLREALAFLKQAAAENKNIMFVATKIQAKDMIKETAAELNIPYVTERWLGGTFTNFDILKERIEQLKELEQKKKSGDFQKYTKKEQAKLTEDLARLERKFGGLREVKELPEVIFVFDMKKDQLACKEARRKGVTVVGVADTNVNPEVADYAIPVNDDAKAAISYILQKVKDAIIAGREKAPAQK